MSVQQREKMEFVRSRMQRNPWCSQGQRHSTLAPGFAGGECTARACCGFTPNPRNINRLMTIERLTPFGYTRGGLRPTKTLGARKDLKPFFQFFSGQQVCMSIS